jgi:hypothetical protein
MNAYQRVYRHLFMHNRYYVCMHIAHAQEI